MKRWQTENTTLRCLAAAAFAISLVVGWAFELRAESRTPAVGSLSPAALKRLGDTIRNEITTGKIPGGILLIQQHGKPVHFECFGVRDPDTGLPTTPDTIFQIYSMSKAVTSVAAMMLVDEGKLALDDSVSKYIHSFAEAKVGVDISDEAGKYPLKLEPLKRPITIRDLLRHTSGITYGFFGETQVQKLYANPLLYAGDFDNADFTDRIAVLPLADQPATRWNYSHSTDVLGHVIEVASGQTLVQWGTHTFIVEQGRAGTARSRTGRTHSLPASAGRTTSSLCPELIYDRHRFSCGVSAVPVCVVGVPPDRSDRSRFSLCRKLDVTNRTLRLP